MSTEFSNRVNYGDLNNLSMLMLMEELTPEETSRLTEVRRFWNFYDGYHYEEIPAQDKPEITENYCRVYVDKLVEFELGKGFSINHKDEVNDVLLNGLPIAEFLDNVWLDNEKEKLVTDIGQMKAVTGDSWVQVKFEAPGQFSDPFREYPNGRVRIVVIPTSICFPKYDSHDKDKLVQLTIAYPISNFSRKLTGGYKEKQVLYKQIWTENDFTIVEDGKETVVSNPYGVIPFVQIKNISVAGRSYGLSDLIDIIPLNVELNLKKSDISEIIDYHAAPVTVIFGASVKSLEKGANKIWGGLPKDANVKNLELVGNLDASVNYIQSLKVDMNEIARVPEGSLGGKQSISNTSGVALQFVNMPIVERTRQKRVCTLQGIRNINKLILLISEIEGLISIPEGIDRKDFFHTDVAFGDTLPKDYLLELQQIQIELQLGLEDRKGAMQRLGRDNIEDRIREIDEDRENHPEIYTPALVEQQLNSGFLNGETPIETVRKEITGKNG